MGKREKCGKTNESTTTALSSSKQKEEEEKVELDDRPTYKLFLIQQRIIKQFNRSDRVRPTLKFTSSLTFLAINYSEIIQKVSYSKNLSERGKF